MYILSFFNICCFSAFGLCIVIRIWLLEYDGTQMVRYRRWFGQMNCNDFNLFSSKIEASQHFHKNMPYVRSPTCRMILVRSALKSLHHGASNGGPNLFIRRFEANLNTFEVQNSSLSRLEITAEIFALIEWSVWAHR